MVEILCTTLPGAFFAATRPHQHPEAARYNVGHFFLALDPGAFRGEGEFEQDLDELIDALHGTKPADEKQPVLVAGELEQACHAERSRTGIPISEEMAQVVRNLA